MNLSRNYQALPSPYVERAQHLFSAENDRTLNYLHETAKSSMDILKFLQLRRQYYFFLIRLP